jgi:hypothetical protein
MRCIEKLKYFGKEILKFLDQINFLINLSSVKVKAYRMTKITT